MIAVAAVLGVLAAWAATSGHLHWAIYLGLLAGAALYRAATRPR